MNIKKLYNDISILDGDYFVIGCSYGPDSMALLKSLLFLRENKNIRIVCAHVNHGKRKESEIEKQELEDYCSKNDVIFEYMKIEQYGDDNFHNEARNIRYTFFDNVIKKYGAKYLLTAHHGDDLIETILMRISRGSTLDGYSGFKKLVEKENYYIYRPLIEYTKEDLVNYCHKYKVPYAIDSSNNSSVYTRNRYRKEVIPFLKNENKNIHERFLKFSRELEDASNYINKEAEKAYNSVINNNVLYINKFLDLDKFIRKIILEKFISDYYQDDLILINNKHIQLVMKLIMSKRSNSVVYLPNDILVTKTYNTLSISRNTSVISNYEIEISDYVKLPNGHFIIREDIASGNSNNIIKLSSKDVSLPLIVRTRRFGDIMEIKGGGHKKVKDIFIDKKIPLKDRDLWPVVVDSKNRIVFIPGLKKSKFDKTKDEFYDIILKYE